MFYVKKTLKVLKSRRIGTGPVLKKFAYHLLGCEFNPKEVYNGRPGLWSMNSLTY